MPFDATEYRNANLEAARQRDRERYQRNKEARKAATIERQHKKRAEELGISLEEFRAQLQAKKTKALDKRIAKARAKVQKAYSPKPGEAGYQAPERKPRKGMGISTKARRLWLKDPELAAEKLRAAQDATEDHVLLYLVQGNDARSIVEAKYEARRAAKAAAEAYRAQMAAEAEAERQAKETARLERLREQYRREFEQHRHHAWLGLDPDTYATGRMFGQILETREGRPVSLEYQAIVTDRDVLSVKDIHRLYENGCPEITRVIDEQRGRLARSRPEQHLHDYIAARSNPKSSNQQAPLI